MRMVTYEEWRRGFPEKTQTKKTEDYARMAVEKEFVSGLTKVSLSGGGPPGTVLYCPDRDTAYIQTDTVHTLISGTTGSGKSVSVIGPTLKYWSKSGCPAVILDAKGELLDLSVRDFRDNGYDVKVLYLRDPMRGIRYNPLTEICRQLRSDDPATVDKGKSELSDILHRLIVGDETSMGSEQLYWCLPPWHFACGLVKELLPRLRNGREATIPMVLAAANMIVADTSSMHRFRKTVSDDSPNLADLLNMLSVFSDVTRSGMTGHLNKGLSFGGSGGAMNDLLSGSDIDIHDISAGKPLALFIVCPDSTNVNDTFLSVVLGQIIHILYDDADSLYGGTLPKEVLFMLDEFANIPRIPAFEKIITTARSRRIRFTIAVQSVAQLMSRYGTSAETVMSNCRDWICTAGDAAFSSMLNSRIGMDASGKSVITNNALRCLRPGHPMVLCGASNPFISDLPMVEKTGDRYIPEKRKMTELPSARYIMGKIGFGPDIEPPAGYGGSVPKDGEGPLYFFDKSEDEDSDVDEDEFEEFLKAMQYDDSDDDGDEMEAEDDDEAEAEDEGKESIINVSLMVLEFADEEYIEVSEEDAIAGAAAIYAITHGRYTGQRIETGALMEMRKRINGFPSPSHIIRTASRVVPASLPLDIAREILRTSGVPESIPGPELDDIIMQLRREVMFLSE